MPRRAIIGVVSGLVLFPAAGEATSQRDIGPPAQVYREPFSQVRGVVELPGGSIMVADYLEERVVILGRGGEQFRVGRNGGGPAEYRLPSGLFPWHGDSVMLFDRGNERFAIVSRDGTIARTVTRFPATVSYGIYPSGVDHRGRIYFAIPPWARGATPVSNPDSVQTARWDEATGRVEQLGLIKGLTRPTKPRSGPGFPFVAFASRDGWAVAGDGAVAVVRGDPYRVEWLMPDGRRVSGPVLQYHSEAVTERDRAAHVRRFLSRNPTSGRGPGGGLGQVPADQISERAVDEMVRTNEFAEVLPPFDPSGVLITQDGKQLWVRRSLPDGAAPIYQVFDRGGNLLLEVRMPPRAEVVALGSTGVYLVMPDEDGLQRLQRHDYP